jgi:hypothetical protein
MYFLSYSLSVSVSCFKKYASFFFQELLALGEVVGTESRGLSTDTLASLPSVIYKTGSDQHGSNDSYVKILFHIYFAVIMTIYNVVPEFCVCFRCVICRVDYEDDESLTILSCKHLYHPECINNWLKINKVCSYMMYKFMFLLPSQSFMFSCKHVILVQVLSVSFEWVR